jgi:hypothetical protein
MTRVSLTGLLAGMVAIAAPWITDPVSGPVTFYKDVLPILQTKCQICHSPGHIAPISFVTYRETRPWALEIKDRVEARRMPPWTLDVRGLHRLLTDREINTLVRWADTGAPRGDPRDAPQVEESAANR